MPLVPVDLAAGEQHRDAYLAINPRRIVPALVLEDGTAIGEVLAIWRYLEDTYPATPLLGATPKERALVTMWERRAELEGFAADLALRRSASTFKEIADLFLSEHVGPKRKFSTAQSYESLLNAYAIPALGNRKAEAVTRAEVARLHGQIGDRPYQANRLLAVIGSLYTFAERRGLVPESRNPAKKIEKFPEDRRERFLTPEELERLGAAIREGETVGIAWREDGDAPKSKHLAKEENQRTLLSPDAAAALRLLVFTGARLREILHLRWDHVDLGRGLLLLPDSKTGRKTIVLNRPALEILQAHPRSGSYVISGTHPDRPRTDLKKPWSAVCRRAGLEGVRLHDLRHTFASIGAGASLGLPIVGKLLGHSQAQTTARYAHLDADPLLRAANLIGERIESAMNPPAVTISCRDVADQGELGRSIFGVTQAAGEPTS